MINSLKHLKSIAIFAIALAVLFQPLTVFAEDGDKLFQDEQSRIGNQVFYYNPNDTCGPEAETSPIVSTPVEGSGAEPILRFFVGKGLTLAAAAGFAGNMKQESGLSPINVQNDYENIDPNKSVNGAGDAKLAANNNGKMYIPIDSAGFGLVQWTFGGYKAGRTDPKDFVSRQGALYKFATERRMDIADINLQLEFVWQELNTGYKVSTLDKLQGITDPVQAAIIVHDNYEISADSDSEVRTVRGGNARTYYNQFKNKISDGGGATYAPTEVTTVSGETCGAQVTTVGGIGEANGLVFPLKTNKDMLAKGADGAVWKAQECALQEGWGSPGNCHHDYNAADIFVPTGTPIIAAKAGKVVSKTTGSCGTAGCNVSIKGEDGLLYYYTHMSKNATVNVGQSIQAGQEVGTVGTMATAMGTPRHLHFDITRGAYRPSCSGAACNDADFINVQPLLIPAYENLPGGSASV